MAERLGIPVVEDNAQAQGASGAAGRTGSLGTIAATSFYPGKNLGAAGDAGAVTTDDAELARTVRELGAHGSTVKYVHDRIGMNSRLDALQAVVLSAKLKRLEGWNALRRRAASRYRELLAGLDGVQAADATAGVNADVWHLYVVQVDERDRVLAELGVAGIGAGIHYPTPLHLTAAYADLGDRRWPVPGCGGGGQPHPVAADVSALTTEQQRRVVDALAEAQYGAATGLHVTRGAR